MMQRYLLFDILVGRLKISSILGTSRGLVERGGANYDRQYERTAKASKRKLL